MARGRVSALDKIYLANVAKYKKEGLDGRPLNLDNYHRGFYHPVFTREAKKKDERTKRQQNVDEGSEL